VVESSASPGQTPRDARRTRTLRRSKCNASGSKRGSAASLKPECSNCRRLSRFKQFRSKRVCMSPVVIVVAAEAVIGCVCYGASDAHLGLLRSHGHPWLCSSERNARPFTRMLSWTCVGRRRGLVHAGEDLVDPPGPHSSTVRRPTVTGSARSRHGRSRHVPTPCRRHIQPPDRPPADAGLPRALRSSWCIGSTTHIVLLGHGACHRLTFRQGSSEQRGSSLSSSPPPGMAICYFFRFAPKVARTQSSNCARGGT
jgi:hypothetical protein